MRNFLLGVVVGASGAIWYTQTRGQVDIDRQFGQKQERANAVLNESRRILEETRRELSSALESGRQTIQQRAERGRGISFGESASTGETHPATE